MDASDKSALQVAVVGAILTAIGLLIPALAAGGYTSTAGLSALGGGLAYFWSHETVIPHP